MILAGVPLFVASYIASQAGVVIIPFDHHHVFGQYGGLIMILVGAIWVLS